jgi:Phosphodiester glycosidase
MPSSQEYSGPGEVPSTAVTIGAHRRYTSRVRWIKVLFVLLLVGAAAAAILPVRSLRARKAPASPWETLEPGLELGALKAPHPSSDGDSKISVLRIDPHRFELRLLNASAPGEGEPLTARGWSRRKGLVAAINASMYDEDHRTSMGLMLSRGHVNNPCLFCDKAILAFDPRSPGMEPVKLIDRECDDLDAWKGHYGTLVQSIRMISCKGENVWAAGGQEWSIAAIGVDRKGRVLFIHSRSAYTPHDLIENLLSLPLDLAGAMYAEGGPEAQLYVHSGRHEVELVGNHSSSLFDSGSAWPVPNVIGVVRKK